MTKKGKERRNHQEVTTQLKKNSEKIFANAQRMAVVALEHRYTERWRRR